MEIKNLKASATRLHGAISSGQHISFLGDCDVDGMTGLMIVIDGMAMLGYKNYDILPYDNREHNVNWKFKDFVYRNDSELAVIIDTGSGEKDLEEILTISKYADVIVGDHHQLQYAQSRMPENLYYVNPTVNDQYPHLSGACVMYEIFMEMVRLFYQQKEKIAENLLSFYALSALYADSIYGDNLYCKQLYEKAQRAKRPTKYAFIERFNVSKRFCNFSLAPLINSSFRTEKFDIINKLFLSKHLLGLEERTRLVGDLQAVRGFTRTLTEEVSEKIQPQEVGPFNIIDLSGMLNQDGMISNKDIWNNKGVVANRVASDTKSCVIAIVSKGNYYTISVRDYYNRDILKLFSTLYSVGGHAPAFGGKMTFLEVMDLKTNLQRMANRIPEKSKQTVVDWDPDTLDIAEIAQQNEYHHSKDLILVRVQVKDMTLGWSPDWYQKTERQFKLVVNEEAKEVYYFSMPKWFRGSEDSVLVHFYKSSRIGGEIVEHG